ncbi:hypothetical protein [Streptomyces sp. AS58]|uniref:hypothetical protein n=1 Tax=Streptomyces sp. AS58 TaxID=1519489 RepID=UPI000B18711E|nr:hypothetical protein [Streptomyces sp. AS58]
MIPCPEQPLRREAPLAAELTGDLDLRDALALCGCTGLPDLDRSQVGYRVTGASGDLCTPALPWGAMDVAPCLTSAQTTRDPAGLTIRYAALDDLIRMRRALGRPKDQRCADELARLRT